LAVISPRSSIVPFGFESVTCRLKKRWSQRGLARTTSSSLARMRGTSAAGSRYQNTEPSNALVSRVQFWKLFSRNLDTGTTSRRSSQMRTTT